MGLRIDGRCHCGQITYEAEINPNNVVVCHCTDCQTFSSAPYRVSVPVLIERFTLHGEPRTYRKRGGSGREVVQNFCGVCGTPIYSAPVDPGTFVNLRLGAVHQRAALAPKRQGFCRSAMPWAFDLDAVEKLPDPSPPLSSS